MVWPFRNLLCRPDLDDLSAIHHRNTSRQITHHRHGVGNKQIRKAELALQLRHQIHDLRANADVKGGDWFVRDNELRTQGQSPGNSDSLALASTEFVWKAAQCGLVKTYRAKQFRNSCAPRGKTG